jgi:hypothetical protein
MLNGAVVAIEMAADGDAQPRRVRRPREFGINASADGDDGEMR